MNYGKTYQRETLTVLIASLQEVQNAIRSYDTKAQVVSIGFIFSLGLITTISSLAPELPEFNFILVCFSWFLGISPIVMFGLVLYPSRSMAPKLGTSVKNLQRSFYLLEERYPSLDNFIAALDKSDWKIEIAYEIQKLSLLRDIKRRWFVWALRITGTSYALMLLVQLLRAAGFLNS